MFSEKDFEKLWFLYKIEGDPKGVSINSFCISNNIPDTELYDWFKSGTCRTRLRNGYTSSYGYSAWPPLLYTAGHGTRRKSLNGLSRWKISRLS